MIKAVALDFDDLTVDSESAWCDIHKEAFSRYGMSFTDDDHIAHYISSSGGTLSVLQRYGKEHLLPDISGLMQELRLKYSERIKFMDGARELIDALYARLPICIVTYSTRVTAEHTCRHLGIMDRMEFLVTRNDCTNQKPHPEPYLTAAARFGIPANEIVGLEDAPKGVASVKTAGMKCIAVPSRFTAGGDFSRADLVVISLADVNLDTIMKLGE